MAKGVCVIGNGISAAQCALTLAELGIEVSIITPSASLNVHSAADFARASSSEELMRLWPLALRAASHPLVRLYTNSEVKTVTGKQGDFVVKILHQPRYVREQLCTSCGRCEVECSVKVQSQVNGQKINHTAIHLPVPGAKGAPSAYCIDKNGIAPCRASCPLGINVQGFTALLAKGKVDKALSLITEAAPMPGILGRLCTHPCETDCKRAEVDNPLFIQALHRYSAVKAPGGTRYTRKAPAGSRKDKIAIVGSGPAGLTCAWELTRRGYTPTIFESHAAVGGMLATGIPRFRLPREVREREVEAIGALGTDIKTGVTVGRDVTHSDLMERGYRAFFLAIGAQRNKKLNIPGEDLEGVADCMSLLFALNLKVGATVGSNAVVIGGGNSAVDSARAAKRQSKGTVRILYRRTAEEMPAIKEDVAEAIQEGITIEYLTAPLEILGDGTRVTGVRCQRMKLGEADADGRQMAEPVPGSEFVIQADHVVVAIGQEPNTETLNRRGLAIGTDGVIKVDPLTLETSIPGVFAGGDCVTGSNTVVEAMAAGLQAAESIDRYLRGHDLKKGRSLSRPEPGKVDVSQRKALPHKRATMPSIPISKRKGTYEETNLGLPPEACEREASRCLSCALCCECLECEQVCDLSAVYHEDAEKYVDIGTERIINFFSPDGSVPRLKKEGVYNVLPTVNGLVDDLTQASAVALEVAMTLEKPEPKAEVTASAAVRGLTGSGKRIGVVLCRCGGSIDSVIDFDEVARDISSLPDVCRMWEVSQACTEEGARNISDFVSLEGLSSVVLAACRCCNLEQVCFSCTDRRVMCQNNLRVQLPPGVSTEFINIREQCAWVHTDDKAGATGKAIDLISAGVTHARRPDVAAEERPIEKTVFVLTSGLGGLAAARDMAVQGYKVSLVSDLKAEKASKRQSAKHIESVASLLKQLEAQGVENGSWPQSLKLTGSPGQYEVVLKHDSQTSRVKAGAVIIDLTPASRKIAAPESIISTGNLLGRILAGKNSSDLNSASLKRYTFGETAGLFVVNASKSSTPKAQIKKGEEAAARASVFLRHGKFSPRASAVAINRKLCRGCGDCAELCPFIEMRVVTNGTALAYLDPAFCYGCGACISPCPTGAITQPVQSEAEIASNIEAFVAKIETASGVWMGKPAKVVVFACNWDGWSCVETAGQNRLSYPASVRVVRVSCLSRVHAGLILKAFEIGVDGVMLLGCQPDNCHFNFVEGVTENQYDKARSILKFLGLNDDRLQLVRLAPGDGAGFVKRITDFVASIERMPTVV